MRGRVHPRDFKLSVVRQLASGEKRPAQICREHNLAPSVVARWQREYEARGDLAFSPKQLNETEALEAKVAELERFCGQLSLENAVLKKALAMLPLRNPRVAQRGLGSTEPCKKVPVATTGTFLHGSVLPSGGVMVSW
jgi:transposase